MPRFSPLLAAVALLCCACAPEQRSWLGALEPITPPAAAGSRFPHLASADDGRVIMSWLEPTGAGYTLRHARWLGASWGEAMTVTSGDDWFINWADFPSVVPVREGRLVAHWLQQSGSGVYSYDVRMAVSDDDGRTWTDSFTPHHDGTQSEHGFVTIFAGPDATGAVWLDGRHTAGGHDHAENAAGAMTLRSASIDDSGIRADQGLEIDGRVCDCCQTDAALTSAGPVVVYRDRSESEIRDIAIVRWSGDAWSEPVKVHDDEWQIAACPVNGPAVAAQGETVVVAWFTAPDIPRVRLAFSQDGGRSFDKPLEVASGRVAGRVDVVLLDDGRAIVSWLAEESAGGVLRVQPFGPAGALGPAVDAVSSSVARSSGFPQMIRVADGLLFAWTKPGATPDIATALAALQ